MLRGFKDFPMRGNLVQLAVAFVMGLAFAQVIQTFVSAIITPIINAFPGATSNGWGFSLRAAKTADQKLLEEIRDLLAEQGEHTRV